MGAIFNAAAFLLCLGWVVEHGISDEGPSTIVIALGCMAVANIIDGQRK